MFVNSVDETDRALLQRGDDAGKKSEIADDLAKLLDEIAPLYGLVRPSGVAGACLWLGVVGRSFETRTQRGCHGAYTAGAVVVGRMRQGQPLDGVHRNSEKNDQGKVAA
ncbi:MAG: hypothetical protein V1899_09695 [Planctomycetota bacterium]